MCKHSIITSSNTLIKCTNDILWVWNCWPRAKKNMDSYNIWIWIAFNLSSSIQKTYSTWHISYIKGPFIVAWRSFHLLENISLPSCSDTTINFYRLYRWNAFPPPVHKSHVLDKCLDYAIQRCTYYTYTACLAMYTYSLYLQLFIYPLLFECCLLVNDKLQLYVVP